MPGVDNSDETSDSSEVLFSERRSDIHKAAQGKNIVIPALLAVLVFCLIANIYFIVSSIKTDGNDQLSPVVQEVKNQSDVPLAISFNNKTVRISAAELSDTLDAATYSYDSSNGTPPLGLMYSYAKLYVLSSIAADEGLTVSDEDISSWLMTTYSNTSVSEVASLTGVSEQGVRSDAERNALIEKLRDEKTKDASDDVAKSQAWDAYVKEALSGVVIEAQGLN